MPVQVNLLELRDSSLHLKGQLPTEELDLDHADELIHLNEPLEYDLWVENEPGGLLVRGSLRTELDCECARCLAPFRMRVEDRRWVCLVALEGEEKVAVTNDCVDLTPQIREDIVLAFPQHPLCSNECQGLKPLSSERSGRPGPNEGGGSASTAWSELDKLKF